MTNTWCHLKHVFTPLWRRIFNKWLCPHTIYDPQKVQTLTCRNTEGAHSHMQGHRRDAPAHARMQKVCAHTHRDSAHCTALLNSGVPLVSTKQTCPTCVTIIESVMEKLRTFTVLLNRYHSRAYCVWVVLLHLFHTFGSLYISLSLFWIYTGWLYMEAAENGRC